MGVRVPHDLAINGASAAPGDNRGEWAGGGGRWKGGREGRREGRTGSRKAGKGQRAGMKGAEVRGQHAPANSSNTFLRAQEELGTLFK